MRSLTRDRRHPRTGARRPRFARAPPRCDGDARGLHPQKGPSPPRPPPGPGRQAPERSPRPDVQAAITALGALRIQPDLRPVDLAGADLTDADLTGADLTGAVLARAVLARADLLAARLVSADLSGAARAGSWPAFPGSWCRFRRGRVFPGRRLRIVPSC